MNYKDIAVYKEQKLRQQIEKLQEQESLLQATISDTQATSYIAFILGTDEFKISKILREKAKQESDIYSIYNYASYIAKTYLEYDKKYCTNLSMYESLEKFLQEYEKQILDFIENGTDIDF